VRGAASAREASPVIEMETSKQKRVLRIGSNILRPLTDLSGEA